MQKRRNSILYLIAGILMSALFLGACNAEPTPIVIEVSETPASDDQDVAQQQPSSTTINTTLPPTESNSADNNVSATNTSAATATEVALRPSITPTLTETALPEVTPTATPAPSETPVPSDTPLPPSQPNVPPASELPVIDASRLGIQVHANVDLGDWNQVIADVGDVGAFQWIKLQLPWKDLEPSPGQYSDLFYAYAIRVQRATYDGRYPFKIMLSVAKAPDWARPEGADLNLDGPPRDPQLLVNFITAFIQETKPEDNRISAIEIWNEPNLAREWSGLPLNGGEYMNLFVPTYNAIKSVAPNITIISAGLAPAGDVANLAANDRRFLQEMYDAGLANYPDVKVGVHPYGWANPPDERCCNENTSRGWSDNRVFFFRDTLADYIDIMQQNGHNSKLWVTEFGWGTYDNIVTPDQDAPVPEAAPQFGLLTVEQQAEYTLRAIEMLQSDPLQEFVELSILWNLNFAQIPFAVANGQEQAGYSIKTEIGSPRLVYFWLKAAEVYGHIER